MTMSPGLAGRLEVPHVPYHSLPHLDNALTHLLYLSFFFPSMPLALPASQHCEDEVS